MPPSGLMPTTLILKARKPGAADTARGRRLHPNSTELNETMKVKIKRFDQELPLPSYQSPGAACVLPHPTIIASMIHLIAPCLQVPRANFAGARRGRPARLWL